MICKNPHWTFPPPACAGSVLTSAFGFWLLAFGFWLLASSLWVLAPGLTYWPLAIWLLAPWPFSSILHCVAVRCCASFRIQQAHPPVPGKHDGKNGFCSPLDSMLFGPVPRYWTACESIRVPCAMTRTCRRRPSPPNRPSQVYSFFNIFFSDSNNCFTDDPPKKLNHQKII